MNVVAMRWLFCLLAACGSPNEIAVPVSRAALDEAHSYELWVVDQADRNGGTLSCADFIARKRVPSAPDVAIVAGPLRAILGGDVELKGLSVGTRMFFIELYAASAAGEWRVGAGCRENVLISPGQHANIALDAR